MNEQRDGFQGWVKWVVVIAALLTISNEVYDAVNGIRKGYNEAANRHNSIPAEPKR